VKMPWRRRTAPSPNPSPSPDRVPPDLLAWADAVDTTQLSEKTVKDAERFLQNYRRMTNLGARARLRCDCDQALRPRSARLRLPRSETWTSLRRSCRRDAGNWVDGNPEYGFTATTSLTGPCTFRPRRQASFLKRLRLTSDTVTFAS